MKTRILTLAIVALTYGNLNATEVNTTSTTIEETTLTRDQIAEVYDWSVKTNSGNYSGTAKTLEEAERMMELVAAGEIVLDRKIESYYQVKETVASNTQRLYFWEVTTDSGSAKGFSNSESQAKRMIELVSTGAILNFKIVQSADFEK